MREIRPIWGRIQVFNCVQLLTTVVTVVTRPSRERRILLNRNHTLVYFTAPDLTDPKYRRFLPRTLDPPAFRNFLAGLVSTEWNRPDRHPIYWYRESTPGSKRLMNEENLDEEYRRQLSSQFYIPSVNNVATWQSTLPPKNRSREFHVSTIIESHKSH